MSLSLDIATPRWFIPWLAPKRYKGAKGGRSGGKSHSIAETVIETLIADPSYQVVCIREVQKSIRHSVKKLLEDKIRKFGAAHLFDITRDEIRRKGGTGLIIFQGLQDHTADSIKSLEGFDLAWGEEANKLSARSLELLLPTIRKPGSELWFSWNPEDETDPIDLLFREQLPPDQCVLLTVNYTDNPFNGPEVYAEAERHRRYSPDTFDHVWLGAYRKSKKAQIFRDKFEIADFAPTADFGDPLFGADWGFSEDPTALIQLYVKGRDLYIWRESYRHGLELDKIADTWRREVPASPGRTIRGDNSRPETINHVSKQPGYNVIAAPKWPGSVEDGIAFIRGFDRVYIHPRCTNVAQEFRLYSYKIDKRTGDVLPDIVDKWNHAIDAIRYALAPLIRNRLEVFE